MRKILFRGKHLHAMSCNKHFDGQWVYGYLCNEKYINSAEYGEMLVDPETVGQYIGLEDINGNHIFEGDIVKWGHIDGSREITERIAIVKINPDIQFERINGTGKTREDCAHIFEYGRFAYKNTSKALEVIGNVHDNPELLRK